MNVIVFWCYSVSQCVAVCCSVLQCVAVCRSVLQCVAVCCSVLQCVAVCCSVLQCVAVCCSVLQCAAVCCSVLQCAAVCCSVLQCVAVRDSCTFRMKVIVFSARAQTLFQHMHKPLFMNMSWHSAHIHNFCFWCALYLVRHDTQIFLTNSIVFSSPPQTHVVEGSLSFSTCTNTYHFFFFLVRLIFFWWCSLQLILLDSWTFFEWRSPGFQHIHIFFFGVPTYFLVCSTFFGSRDHSVQRGQVWMDSMMLSTHNTMLLFLFALCKLLHKHPHTPTPTCAPARVCAHTHMHFVWCAYLLFFTTLGHTFWGAFFRSLLVVHTHMRYGHKASLMPHMNESCHIWHIWMSHVT